jgi:hypothetical protein
MLFFSFTKSKNRRAWGWVDTSRREEEAGKEGRRRNIE